MSDQTPDKSFLVQKFARIPLGQFHVIGYSVAGEETLVQVPELNVCFDLGRAPYFALTSDIACITHGHMDHIAGLPYYLSQRYFQGMKPGKVLLPREIVGPVDAVLRSWREVERQATPYELIPMSPGDTYQVRRDFKIRSFATHHGGPSLGYSLISVREKLKPEFIGQPGQQIAALRKKGVQVQYPVEVPLFAYLGDTALGPVFDHPDVINAQVLITECTFYDTEHKTKAKAGRHLHLDQLIEIIPKLKNQHLVLIHISRRTGIRRARTMLKRKLADIPTPEIHFLMDFEGAQDAGDIDTAVAQQPDNPE